VQTIWVIIPAYESIELLEEAVSSVSEAATRTGLTIKTAVIDCHPGQLDRFIAPRVDHYAPIAGNPGFGSACNLGITHALNDSDCSWVMLLNPDASVASSIFQLFEDRHHLGSSRQAVLPMILRHRPVLASRVGRLAHAPKGDGLLVSTHDQQVSFFHGDGRLVFRAFDERRLSRPDTNEARLLGESDDFVVVPETFKTASMLVENESGDSESVHVTANSLTSGMLIDNAGNEYLSPAYTADLGGDDLFVSEVWNGPIPRNAFCGAGVFLSRQLLTDVGGFDERFFLYYEDTELSARANRAGYEFLLDPDLRVFHHHSGSTGKDPAARAANLVKSRILFATITHGVSYGLFLLVHEFKKLIRASIQTKSLSTHPVDNLSNFNASAHGFLRYFKRKRFRQF
jgi:GT2 family glycosyltransferase